MPKPLVIAAIAFSVVLVVGLVYATRLCACDHETSVPTPHLEANPSFTPPALPTACGANPAPAVNVGPTEFGYRKLTSPAAEQPVSSPLRIAGQANPFEGAYSVTILDRQGRIISAQNFFKDNRTLDFSTTLEFEVLQPMPACVQVHERSGRDGSPINITQIAVLLLP